jgi:hypothetical protein
LAGNQLLRRRVNFRKGPPLSGIRVIIISLV